MVVWHLSYFTETSLTAFLSVYTDLESETRANTVWVVLGDIEPSIISSNHSLKLLAQAAKFMRRHATMDTRLGFVLNPFSNISTSGKIIWGDPGWLTRALLLIGHPAERLLSSSTNETSTSEKYMSIIAAKNFAIKVTEEALKVARGEAKEISPLSAVAVSVSSNKKDHIFYKTWNSLARKSVRSWWCRDCLCVLCTEPIDTIHQLKCPIAQLKVINPDMQRGGQDNCFNLPNIYAKCLNWCIRTPKWWMTALMGGGSWDYLTFKKNDVI